MLIIHRFIPEAIKLRGNGDTMLIGGYNITAEIISLVLSSFLVFLMFYSNPRKTNSYKIIYYGVLISIVAIITQIALIYVSSRPDVYSKDFDTYLCCFYLILYFIMLALLYSYINMLSTKTRHNMIYLYYRISLFGAIYALGTILYLVQCSKSTVFSYDYFTKFYLCFGLLTCFFCIFAIIRNQRTTPKIMNKYATIFIPLDFVILAIQFHINSVIFTSLSYVLPFLIFYMLFHSNPYDEVIGCQNQHSFDARFTDSLIMKRQFLIVYLRFPQLKNVNSATHNEYVEEISAKVCREIEQLHNMIHIYRLKNDEYAMMLYIKDDSKIRTFLDNLEAAITNATLSNPHQVNYRIVALQNNPVLSTCHRLSSMSEFLFDKSINENGNSCYLATDRDYRDFHEAYKIEQLLFDIRNQNDLDDERVLCYAQPIFSVNEQSFRTAEALMRLSLDGTIISPDRFIPIAEKNNCIHVLTRIMLNKVCRIVHDYEQKYDFDAITINCSSSELSNRNLFNELMEIINNNDVEPNHIRLELTESAIFEDFEIVLQNMEKLNKSGIKFYLDDFGTGYSNLERIIGCPFYTIKFDKSLLYKSLNNPGVSDIVSHMVSVFKKQGFVLLIEGVENDEQNSYSINQGFDYIQGYRYAKPVPVINLKDYFTKSDKAV